MPNDECRVPRTNFTARLGNNLLAYLVREQIDPALWRPALEVAIALLPVRLVELREQFPEGFPSIPTPAPPPPPPASQDPGHHIRW